MKKKRKIRLGDGIEIVAPDYTCEDWDRHGNLRIYVRHHGRKIRIRDLSTVDAFFAEYRTALHGAPSSDPPHRPAPVSRGTLRWLVQSYLVSTDFLKLHESTRYARRGILENICEVHGTKPYALMEARHVKAVRDEKFEFPEAANGRVKALRQVFAWAIEEGHTQANPARNVTYVKNDSEGWHTWTLDEVRQYEERHPIGSKARLAMALLLFTGVRRSDAVKLGRQHLRDGSITFTVTKNRNRKPVTLTIPVLPQLQAVLESTRTGNMTFLVTQFDKPFSNNGFGNWFKRRCKEAGLPNCSAHGLRKTGATIAAENGATEYELMAIFGWASAKEAARYTKAARQKLLAKNAMSKLVPGQNQNESVPLSDVVLSSGTKARSK